MTTLLWNGMGQREREAKLESVSSNDLSIVMTVDGIDSFEYRGKRVDVSHVFDIDGHDLFYDNEALKRYCDSLLPQPPYTTASVASLWIEFAKEEPG